jgi:hypothetical protein
MRVYKFLTSEYAIKDIWERKLKISEISDLNDPFELIPCDLSDPRKTSCSASNARPVNKEPRPVVLLAILDQLTALCELRR